MGNAARRGRARTVTSYQVRHRQIGTSPWQNVTVMSDDCCAATITGLTNRRHYEVQAAAVNRLGTGPWAGPVNVTPQAPYSAPPAPTGDADLSLDRLALHWTTTGSNVLDDSCTGPKSFYIIWTDQSDTRREQTNGRRTSTPTAARARSLTTSGSRPTARATTRCTAQ